MSATRRLVVVGTVIALVLVGCSSGDRPDVASWLPAWESIQEVIPSQAALGSPPDEALCQDVLAELRSSSADLRPSPSDDIESLVNEWVEVAEGAFFDCPPEDEEGFSGTYEELARIGDSIDAAVSDLT